MFMVMDKIETADTITSNTAIKLYKSLLEKEMIKMGASERDLKLIKDATIRNALRNNRKPEDVAWALMQ